MLLTKNNLDIYPDIYKDKPIHERLGVSFIGVRKPLLAFNVNYKINDQNIKEKLNELAKKIRESNNGIKNVQAKVFYLQSKNLYQLSLNILDILNTDFYFIFETIKQYSKELNLEIENTEIVGLIPAKTVENILNNYLIKSNFEFKKTLFQFPYG
jgi:glutamate formiminotransferase